jgi:hypothetical protein
MSKLRYEARRGDAGGGHVKQVGFSERSNKC